MLTSKRERSLRISRRIDLLSEQKLATAGPRRQFPILVLLIRISTLFHFPYQVWESIFSAPRFIPSYREASRDPASSSRVLRKTQGGHVWFGRTRLFRAKALRRGRLFLWQAASGVHQNWSTFQRQTARCRLPASPWGAAIQNPQDLSAPRVQHLISRHEAGFNARRHGTTIRRFSSAPATAHSPFQSDTPLSF